MTRPLLVALAVTALAGCRAAPTSTAPAASSARPTASQGGSAASAAPAAADTTSAPLDGPAFGLARVRTERPAPPPVATLRSVRAAAHAGFDRVVFAFGPDDPAPGVDVGYGDGNPPIACGSGEPLALREPLALLVSAQPARSHDDRGEATVEAADLPRPLSAVRSLTFTCAFEAELAWAVGVPARRPFRVFTLQNPTRVVVDVQH